MTPFRASSYAFQGGDSGGCDMQYHKIPYSLVLIILVLTAQGQVLSSKIARFPSEKKRDLALEVAILNAFDDDEVLKQEIIPDKERQTRYYYNHVDLNGDSKLETLTYLVNPRVCGTGGCLLLVFTKPNGKYKLVSEIVPVRPPIIVSEYKTNGWKNLYGFVAGGGITKGYFSQLLFDGKSYPESPFEPSSNQQNQPLTGVAYIADDLSKFRGISLIP
jgi:hypothetical protein